VSSGVEEARLGQGGDRRERRLSTPVLLGLIWAVGASGVLLLFWGSKLTFLLDDWEFLIYRQGFTAHAILEPHGEHISIAPILIYKALLATFGMSSAFPFRVVSTGAFLLSAVLFFALLRRRVGEWLALAATVLVLFVGAGWEDLLWSFQIGYFGSMAAGLGMLLMLEREDRRGDQLACLLLTVSIIFSSLGIPFAIAAAVLVLLQPNRVARLYVFVLPLILYAIWYLGWGHNAESALSASNVSKTPSFVLDGIASSMASIFGLFGPGAGGLGWGRPLAVAAIGLALWRQHRLGRVATWTWVLLALGLSFWILAGFNQIPGRTPEASRYQYIGVIFTLLFAAELMRGLRLSWEWLTVVGVAVVVITISNIGYLHAAWGSYHDISELEKADLGALEIARGTVEPSFSLEEEEAGTGYVHIEAGPYFEARDKWGSPAYDPAELAESVPQARLAADRVLFAAERIEPESVPVSALPSGPVQSAEAGADGLVEVPAGGCVSAPSGPEAPLLGLPPAGAYLQAGSQPVTDLRMRRYSEGELPIDLETEIPAHGAEKLATPADGSKVPWQLQVESQAATLVCGIE
jgi:hypothetical protein